MPLERTRTAGLTDEQLAALRAKWRPLEQVLQFAAVTGMLVAVVQVVVAATSLSFGEVGQGASSLVAGAAMGIGSRWAWRLDRRARGAMLGAAVAWGVFVGVVGVLSAWTWLPFVVAGVPWLPFFTFVLSDEYREVVVPAALARTGTRFVRPGRMLVVALLAILAAIVVPALLRGCR
jgi:hypothetical protein